MRYQTRSDPAPNAQALLDFLLSQEGPGNRYIYRGQLKEWPGPLLPSLYRRSIQRGRILTERDPEFHESGLRGCGRSFVEIQPDSGMARILLEAGPSTINQETYLGLVALARDREFCGDLCISGHDRAFLGRLHPDRHESARTRLALWRRIVDEIHRADIRQWGFLQPYGYVLGMTLAQQFGFTSELLDFTSQPAVAIFFATHPDPYYLFAPVPDPNLGVVCRLPSNEGAIAHARIDSFKYSTSPPQVHMSEVCKRFEDRSSPEMLEQLQDILDEETMSMMLNGSIALGAPSARLEAIGSRTGPAGLPKSVDQFLRLYYEGGGIRYYRLLDAPPGAFASSRMGRQAAVAVVADELRKTAADPDGDCATFQAVEDVSSRLGFERFYFRHSNRPPDLSPICREYLWPDDDDYFKMLISRVIDPDTHTYRFRGRAIPKRMDLISGGYTPSPPGCAR